MIAVSWTGAVYALNSYTGATTLIAPGLFGQNALARDGQGRLWSTQRTPSTPYVYDLTRIDPRVPSSTLQFANTADVRGMTGNGGTTLLAVINAAVGTADSLASIDVATGAITTIGATGLSALQSIAVRNGVIYAFDLTAGLVTLNPSTGIATDVNPSIGGSGTNLQWLAFRADGQLVGGGATLFTINPTTGATSAFGPSLPDLRGAELWQNFTLPYGTGCAGSGGVIALSATLSGTGPTQLQTTSNNHATNVAGIAVFGLSNTLFNGVPLPLLLDPIFGTSGCQLYASVDASVGGIGTGTNLAFAFQFPPTVDVFPFFVQHVALEPVAGGLSVSNGQLVQIGF
jgi:hypothetical protein